ncbi:MAG: plastocyanin/azurin family copper-binding protein [Phycisphaerae bacterium]
MVVVLGLVAASGGATLATVAGCPTASRRGSNDVFMMNIAFEPTRVSIDVGETVTWINQDIVPHTATSGNPDDADLGSLFRSRRLARGERFSHTFEEPGSFRYFCEVHPGMMRDALVVVREP